MGRTDWLAPLRNGFPTTSRTRSRRRGPGSVEALERRIPLSDPLGLLTGAALLGGGLAAAEAEAAPPADDAVPAPEEDRRAAGASLPADDESAFPPPEILEANTVAAAPPPPSSPAAPPAASALTADLLDDLLAPPPAASSPAPAADLARDPLVDTSPKTGGGGAGGHDAAGGSGGGGQDGARSRGGLIADEPADGTTGDGTADLSGDAVAFSTTSGGGYGSGSGGGSGSGSGGGEPPVAVDDAFEVNYTRRTTTTANVVGNDRNYNQYGAQVVLVTPPQDHDGSQGAFVLDATGSFNYLAPHDWDLSDTFTYKITSPNGDSTEATVTLGFQDSPPTGAEDNYACLADAPLVVSADKGVLANDSDIDRSASAFPASSALGLEAELVTNGSHGSVSLNPDGSFTYTASDPDWYGTDTFTYRLWDTVYGVRALAFPYALRVEVNVDDLRIFHDGVDVTNGTTDIWIGEKADPSVQLVGPGGLQFQGEPVWTVPGRAVSDYDMTRTSAVLVPFLDAEGTTIDFYWITSGAKNVSVTAAVVGANVNAQAAARGTFNVKKPTVNVLALMEDVHLWHNFDPPDDSPPSLLAGAGDAVVQFGDWHEKQAATGPDADIIPGIQFRYTSDAETGAFQWVQVVEVTMFRRTDAFGNTLERSGANVLDGGIPYGGSGYNDPSVDDSPWNNLPFVERSVKRVDRFSMYLMYKPVFGDREAIWVPLTRTPWHWRYEAVSANGTEWEFVSGSVDKGINGTTHEPDPPEWAGNFDDLTSEPVP